MGQTADSGGRRHRHAPALLVVPIVSLLTQQPKPEIIAAAFGDKSSPG
jgi:hypothetical protein